MKSKSLEWQVMSMHSAESDRSFFGDAKAMEENLRRLTIGYNHVSIHCTYHGGLQKIHSESAFPENLVNPTTKEVKKYDFMKLAQKCLILQKVFCYASNLVYYN